MAATAFSDNSADVEVFRDYAVGLWQVQATYGYAANVRDYKFADDASLRIRVLPMNQSSYVRINQTWGGASVEGCSALEFFISGRGKSVVPYLGVKAGLSSGNGQVVPMSRYVKQKLGEWTKISIPLTALGLTNGRLCKNLDFVRLGSTDSTFWLDEIRFTRPVEFEGNQVSINPTVTVGPITNEMFGAATFTWDETMLQPSTVDRLKEGGVRLLSFPGGNSANQYDWRTSTDVTNGGVGPVTTEKFLQIAKQVGADTMISVNYGSGTPQDAADWVSYAKNVVQKPGKYWSIGNEPFGGWAYDTNPFPHDALTYADFVQQAAVLMRAADPNIKIGIACSLSEYDYPQRVSVVNPRTGAVRNGWGPVLLDRLRQLNVTIDYVDVHFYPTGPGMESDSYLLQSAGLWRGISTEVRQMLVDYLGAARASQVGIHIGENNSIYWLPGKQSTNIVNALYLAESWGKAIHTNGMSGFNWWNLHNLASVDGNMSPTLRGWRALGDYGLLSRGIPAGVAPEVNYRYPTFYAFKMLKEFANDGDSIIPASSTNPLLSAYAVLTPKGAARILFINKSAQSAITTNLSLGGQQFNSVKKWQYDAQMDADQTGVLYIPAVKYRGEALTFPPYSMTVIEFAN